MADGLIIRRGGGSGTTINIISAQQTAMLPASAKEDTIAVIGSGFGAVYVQEAIPAVVAEGDIWITPEDKVFDINLAKKGSILIGVGNVYQYIQGEWCDVDAHIFRNGRWQQVWNKVLYSNGKMSGRVAYFEKLSPTTCKVTYGDSYIQCVTKAGSASEVYAVFGPVDLTYMSSLEVTGTFPKAQNGTTYAVLAVSKSADASFTDAATDGEYIEKMTVKDNKAGLGFGMPMDISALDGEWYVYIGTNTAGGNWANARTVNFTELKGE